MWAQLLNMLLGIWLMAAPQLLHYKGIAADNDHILGPVVSTFAIIALSGCTRAVARYNIILGAWLFLAPWLLGYEKGITIINDAVVGFLVTVFSFFKRKTNHHFGSGWSGVWKRNASQL